MDLQSMLQSIDLQAFLPTFIIELAVALVLAVVLVGLLWMVGRIRTATGKRVWRVLRWLITLILQVTLFGGAMFLILRYLGLDVAWLVLVFTLMSSIGGRLAWRNASRWLRPGPLDNRPMPAVLPALVVAAADIPVAETVAQAELTPDYGAIPALAGVISAPSDVTDPVAIAADIPAHTSEAEATPDTILPDSGEQEATPDEAVADTSEQEAVPDMTPPDIDPHLAAPNQRPWQSYVPGSLRQHSVLGKQSIRTLRTRS